MVRSSKRPAELRDSWRARDDADVRARQQRRLRRCAAVGVLAVLVAAWYYALFEPVWHPNIHLLTAAAVDYEEPVGRERRFARSTAQSLRDRAAPVVISSGDEALIQLRTPDDFAALGDRLRATAINSSDVVVVWLQAHGVSIDGQGYLLCENFTVANPDVGRFPLAQLLELLRQSPAQTKLLLLDGGGRDHDPRIGTVVNDFSRLLCETVEATGDESLWVLHAYSSGERSQIDPGLKQTVFGHFVGRALAGEADRNDDRLVDVAELFHFAHDNMVAWVTDVAGGFGTQTPFLVRGSKLDPLALPTKYPTVVPVALDLKAIVAALPAPTGTAAPPPTAAAPTAVAVPTPTSAAAEKPALPTPSGTAPAMPKGPTPPTAVASATAAAAPVDPTIAALLAVPRKPPLVVLPTFVVPRPDLTPEQLLENNRDTAASLLDRARQAPTPLDYAPHRWQVVESAAFALERRRRDPATDREQLEPSLRRFSTALAALAANTTVTGVETVAKVAAWRAPPPLDLKQFPSWALVERWSADAGTLPPPDFQSFATALDTAFADPQSDAWFDLKAKPWPAGSERYDEFAFAQKLAAVSTVPWTTLQLAWRTCREGEGSAGDAAATIPAVAEQILEADRRRESGRRALFDQIGGDWSTRAEVELRRALVGYRAASATAFERHRSEHLRNDLIAKSSAYIAWHRAGAGDTACSPTHAELEELLTELGELTRLLRDPAEFDAVACADHRRTIERLVERIESPLSANSLEALIDFFASPIATRRRIEVLLSRPFLAPTTRRRLEEAAARIDAAAKERPAVPRQVRHVPFVAPPDAVTERQARLTAELDVQRARIAGWKDSFSLGTDAATTQQLGTRLSGYFAGLPALTERVVADNRDRTVPATRLAKLTALFAADDDYRFIDPRDDVRTTFDSPARSRVEAEWYDRLTLNRRRYLLRRNDAAPADAIRAAEAAEQLADAARTLPSEPTITPPPADIVRLTGLSALSPEEDAYRDFAVGVESLGVAATPIWLQVEYDAELLELKLPSGMPLYPNREFERELQRRAADAATERDRLLSRSAAADELRAAELKAEQLRRAALFPGEPEAAGLPPTVTMNPGELRSLKFAVRRRSTAAGRTAILVRAISGETHVRHAIDVQLPPVDTITFAPAMGSGSWTPRSDGVVLHPWPNRSTDYEFQLRNLGATEAVVDVEFVAPQRRPDGALPKTLRAVQTGEVAALIGPSQTVVKIDELKLPADGRPVTLAAPKPKEANEPPKTPDEKNRADSTVGKTATTKDAPPPIDVRQGLLLVVRRRDTGETLLRRIDFRPERPRKFLKLKVGYNPALERIEIRATPLDRTAFPSRGVAIRAKFPEPLPRGTEAQLEGRVEAPDYSTLLYVEAPASASRVQTVYIDVDDYPRAFVYRVPCGAASTDLPEAADVLDVRLTAPEANAMFSAPAESILTEVQVDAPPGSFEYDRDVLEVGIDRDRDRDFANEQTLVLHSDRQADVFVETFGTNGIVTLKTDVHDFKLAVPGAALQNVRVNLVGRVQVGPRTAWSRPIEIGLDGAPPKISRVELKPDRLVTKGVELVVDVWSTDGEMSGTAEVDVGFDIDQKGTFSEKLPPVKAATTAPPRWTAKLPTADLPTGPVTLLVRARDKLGHVGEITKVKMQIVAPSDLAAGGSRVVGTVRYGGLALGKATILLEGADAKAVGTAESDAEGRFAIEGVPPGTYRLAARGVARNRPRTAEQSLVVPPPPAKVPRVELELK